MRFDRSWIRGAAGKTGVQSHHNDLTTTFDDGDSITVMMGRNRFDHRYDDQRVRGRELFQVMAEGYLKARGVFGSVSK